MPIKTTLEPRIRDHTKREVTLAALAEEIRRRMSTPRSLFVDREQAFSSARVTIEAAHGVSEADLVRE